MHSLTRNFISILVCYSQGHKLGGVFKGFFASKPKSEVDVRFNTWGE